MLNSILVILCLIAVSAFFSMSEISLAASRKIKLKLLADEGNINAQRVLNMQENPCMFFTLVQNGLNAVAILGGIVGDAAFSPAFHSLFSRYMSAELSEQLSFILSFSLVTGMFILFADLTPKRTDSVKFAGYKFEVVDIDNYRIDQLLVTRIDSKATALSPKLPDAKDKEESVA